VYKSQVPTTEAIPKAGQGKTGISKQEFRMNTLMPILFALALMAITPSSSEGSVRTETQVSAQSR
jgi:hypothetical protein